MEKEKIIDLFNSINNVKEDRNTLYKVMDELGIKFKKTRCLKCLQDYYNIVREELGFIESATEVSDFNGEAGYVYIAGRPQTWNGVVIDGKTDPETIRKFIEKHPVGYYKKTTDDANTR